MTERMDVNRLVMEMRAMKAQAFASAQGSMAARDVAAGTQPTQQTQQVNGPKFSDLMSQALDKVNEVQHASGDVRNAYIKGDPNVDITEVMIASQKAGIAFDSAVQVRNRLVEAYRDVMNMPI